jgi:hypothetical protein
VGIFGQTGRETWHASHHFSPVLNSFSSMSETRVTKPAVPVSSNSALPASGSIYVATSAEVDENWLRNRANRWYKKGANPDHLTGDYAFQRLRQTWFTPKIEPKFKLRQEDKFYAIGVMLRPRN